MFFTLKNFLVWPKTLFGKYMKTSHNVEFKEVPKSTYKYDICKIYEERK